MLRTPHTRILESKMEGNQVYQSLEEGRYSHMNTAITMLIQKLIKNLHLT